MAFLKIVLLSIASAVVYGILHDQVTARVCVEYFTIGHPPVFATQSPTLLALGWGTIATWWAGLIVGVPLAIAARAGERPKLRARDLLKPSAVLLLIMASVSFLSGLAGYALASAGRFDLAWDLAAQVPLDRHVVFLADAAAHSAAYATGFLGGLGMCAWAWVRRGQRASADARRSDRQLLGVFILGSSAAIVYAVAHNALAALLAPAGFLASHPPFFGLPSTLLQALLWGIFSSW